MSSVDTITQSLMSKGSPFEVVPDGSIRVFKHAPATMSDVFRASRNYGRLEFIVSGDRRITYDDFFSRCDALSSWMTKEGVLSPGQSMAICMKNCPEWMIAYVAILNAGGVAVLINSRSTGDVMARAVEDADCVFIFADERRLEKLRSANCDLPALSPTDFPVGHSEYAVVPRDQNDLATMFFTSGTTGVAKAAAISHRALITGMMNTQMAMAAVFQKMAKSYKIDVETLRAQMPQSCSLLVFPLFHTSGCSAVFLTALTTGGKLVLMDRWDADEALALIEKEKITSFGGVPTMHWDLLRSSSFGNYDLSSLMSVSCGGQALPQNLLTEIREAFPRAYIGAGYGMTETCGAISQANGEAFLSNPTASGQVLPMVDVQITGEDGQALEIGQTGEIWAKGATLMEGYYGRPDDTAASKSGDWFKTGDIGRLDENGYIYIVDRKTDMVISGGENIYCAEVEQVLSRHSGILAIGTFGIADDRLGERLIASVQVKDGVTASDIKDYAEEHLAAYKVPTDITVQTKPFELNAMGKIQKQKIRATYLAQKEKGEAY